MRKVPLISAAGRRRCRHPRNSPRVAKIARNEKVARPWERINGSMGLRACRPGKPARECCPAEAGRNSPAKCSGSNIQIAARRPAGFGLQYCSVRNLPKFARQGRWATCFYAIFYLRLSVLGSGWISTRNSSGNSCLNLISRSVETSCTLESGRSSDMVQWPET